MNQGIGNIKQAQVFPLEPVLRLEATPGFEPGNQGFADPCLTTWLCRRVLSVYAGRGMDSTVLAIDKGA